jgi:hypothetical protein
MDDRPTTSWLDYQRKRTEAGQKGYAKNSQKPADDEGGRDLREEELLAARLAEAERLKREEEERERRRPSTNPTQARLARIMARRQRAAELNRKNDGGRGLEL